MALFSPRGFLGRKKAGLFVSYNHHSDGTAYERFSRFYAAGYWISQDKSMERELGTTDASGHAVRLAEHALAQVQACIVLCGAHATLDPFVDWEIQAALKRRKGLIAVVLEGNPGAGRHDPELPPRLRDNFDSGYAVQCHWWELEQGKQDLSALVRFAMLREASLIRNQRPLMAFS